MDQQVQTTPASFITQPKEPRAFSTVECVFAWISLLVGYWFCRVFPVGTHPLGGFLLVMVLYSATAIVLKIKGYGFEPLPLTAAASGIAVSVSLIVSANGFFHFFAYTYALAAYGYFLYATTGNRIKAGFSDFLAADFLKALFVMPFSSFGELFRGMFSGKAKNSGAWIVKLLAGAAIAIVPTALVLALLSYDSDFSDLLASIFTFDFGDVVSHVFSLLFAIPIGAYLFGAFVSSVDNKCRRIPTQEAFTNAARRIRIAPCLTVLAATLPLTVIYILFFVSQWQYYVSGFTGVLPRNFSYATYAREGFFQLCAVSVINLVMIVAATLFTQRKQDRPPVFLRILVCVFSVMTLILISTAIAKMVMYIGFYGLTQKRVYATWFMLLIAVVFVILAVKQFVRKLPALAVSLVVCVGMFAALSLSGVNGWIAAYNVDRYLDGDLKTVDVDMMRDLSDEAIPELVRLYEELRDEDSLSNRETALMAEVKTHLRQTASQYREDDGGWTSITAPRLKAEAALKTAGFLS